MTAVPHKLALPPLYAIVDPEQAGGRPPDEILHRLLEGGARLVQLRAKTMSSRDFLRIAKGARALTASRGCRLIVNDRVDIALASAADGVHLGQEDLPLRAARKLLGEKLIGISTHDLEQALEAERDGADYIGFGPIFSTATKNTGYTERGLEMLAQIRASVALPIVAIGGISEENVAGVWRAGADAAAIISDILKSSDMSAKVTAILRRAEARKLKPEKETHD